LSRTSYRRSTRSRVVLAALLAASVTVVTLDFRQGSGGPLRKVQDQVLTILAPLQSGVSRALSPVGRVFRSVGDIAYLYLDLLDRLDLHQATLVGSSFGGWLALEIAVRSTARIARLVLIDSLGLKFGGREERDIADIYALPADEVLRRTFTDPGRFVPDYATLDDAELQAIAHDREATALYGWKPYMHNPALAHWLHRVTVPSLVLWGAEDGIVAPSYGEKLAAALPDARFEHIAGAAHYPQIEHPEAVADHIARFAQENRP